MAATQEKGNQSTSGRLYILQRENKLAQYNIFGRFHSELGEHLYLLLWTRRRRKEEQSNTSCSDVKNIFDYPHIST